MKESGAYRVFKNLKIRITAILAFLSLSLVVLYYQGFIRFNYPDITNYSIRGIDISHHQGDIDWLAVPKDKIHFVYIKATEGGDFVDPKFSYNLTEAKKSGFAVGAYHFFTLCRSGLQQAENLIRTVPADKNQLPIAIDLEFTGNCSKRPDKKDFLIELERFQEKISGHYGKKPLIYTTEGFSKEYLKGALKNNQIWMRGILRQPQNDWIIWQYADNGRIKGIAAAVDLNVLNGNKDTLIHLVNGK